MTSSACGTHFISEGGNCEAFKELYIQKTEKATIFVISEICLSFATQDIEGKVCPDSLVAKRDRPILFVNLLEVLLNECGPSSLLNNVVWLMNSATNITIQVLSSYRFSRKS